MKLLRMNQIKLSVLHKKEDLDQAVQKILHCKTIPQYTVVKQSIDARDKSNLRYIYSVEVSVDDMKSSQINRLLDNNNIMLTDKQIYDFPSMVSSMSTSRTEGTSGKGTSEDH